MSESVGLSDHLLLGHCQESIFLCIDRLKGEGRGGDLKEHSNPLKPVTLKGERYMP